MTESKDKSKAIIKGARLKLYPPGFNLFRHSRGIELPETWQMSEEKAQADPGKDDLQTVIPEFVVDTLARCLFPKIQAYFDSPEGQAEFEAWKQWKENP